MWGFGPVHAGREPQPKITSMRRSVRTAVIILAASTVTICSLAQSAPPSPDKVWHSRAEQSASYNPATVPTEKFDIDPHKTYSLAELIDLAEQHNPETRLAWQTAKGRAAVLGIERSAFYPTLVAVALANTARARILFGTDFIRQTYGVFQPELHVDYLIFYFGGRSGAIDAAKADLLAANLTFNNTHLRIIYQVTSAYYHLLNAMGQMDAAEASLKNAQAVEEDAQDRL